MTKSPYAGAAACLVVISIGASVYVHARGYTLFYGDAEAHLNIARRWFDSRTPGPEQLGTVWLPLPHLLMTPFVLVDCLWRNGLAGVIPSCICFVLAGMFLFASVRSLLSLKAACAALAVFALNPNMLYLQSLPMTESVFAAALLGLLWTTLRFRETQLLTYVLAAAAASVAASLTRYEGWFLIPFVTLFFLIGARKKWHAFVFGALAALAPLAWIAPNQFYWSDALAFYHGPYSALAIYQRQLAQGLAGYPGGHNWLRAIQYFSAAVTSVGGWPVLTLATCGIVVAVFSKKLYWPLLLLALPPVFYVMSIHSSGTPVYVPYLWPNSWYNTRYGLAALPLLALLAAALVNQTPGRAAWIAVAVAALGATVASPITWKESQVNSIARRAWTNESAAYLKDHYTTGEGILYYFGDLAGVFREAGIPLREGLHQDNRQTWDPAVLRPDLFLHEEWALAVEGDPVSNAMRNAHRYKIVKRVIVKDAPVVEIYRRDQ